MRINGRWLAIDPREWRNRYNMTVSVGVGTFGRQQQIANLSLIGQAQEKVLPLGLATPANIYQTAKRTVEAMGYRDSEQFFTAPQEQPQPQLISASVTGATGRSPGQTGGNGGGYGGNGPGPGHGGGQGGGQGGGHVCWLPPEQAAQP